MASRVIAVLGGNGMVGRALRSVIQDDAVVCSTRDEVDLRQPDATARWFKKHKVTHVINVAANVGGIMYNIENPVDMLEDNVRLATSILRAAHECDIQHVVSVLSTCVFPTHLSEFDETQIHDGPAHESNAGYAYSKRVLLTLSQSYGRQYGRSYTCLIPPNLYGPNDAFDGKRSHVVPALIRKFHDAAVSESAEKRRVVVYGTGAPLRQLMHARDLARLLVWALDNYHDTARPLLVAAPGEFTVRQLVTAIASHFPADIAITYDATKPNGQMRKFGHAKRMHALLPPDFSFTSLEDGLAETIRWFLQQQQRARQTAGDGAAPLVPRVSAAKRALVLGATGQDGCYLTRLLLQRGYHVFALVRRSSVDNMARIRDILCHLNILIGDLTDACSIQTAVQRSQPTEIYNLAAQSHVLVSFQLPNYTATVDALGAASVLDAAREFGPANCRVYQASTSELFGSVSCKLQNEHTELFPVSPYGLAKRFAFDYVRLCRDAYKLYAVNGILFNHESEVRGHEFVTRKITLYVADWFLRGFKEPLRLGNLDALRDWGHAEDYVEGMWMMMQQDKPIDMVLATGNQNTVREFVTEAFANVRAHITWSGVGLEERGMVGDQLVVVVDPALFRPSEVDTLCGNPSRAVAMGWRPRVYFRELVHRMVAADCHRLRNGLNMNAYVCGNDVPSPTLEA